MKISLFILCLLMIPFSDSQAKIIQTKTLTPIEREIAKSDQNTLVVFVIDDVLIVARDDILKPYNKPIFEAFKQELANNYSTAKAIKLSNIVLRAQVKELVDNKSVHLLNMIQARGAKALALFTPGGEKEKTDGYLNQINEMGYDFAEFWPDLKPVVLYEAAQDRECLPVAKKGALFACSLPKEKVVSSFLLHERFKHLVSKYPHIPTFEQYAVKKTTFKKARKIDLFSHPQANFFKEVLTEGFKQTKNIYANHYTIVSHECGKKCQRHWIIDLRNGQILVGNLFSTDGIMFMPNSRLIILNADQLLYDVPAMRVGLEFLTTSSFGRINKVGEVFWPQLNDFYASEKAFKKIIYIDSQRKEIEAMEHFAEQAKLTFVGFEYMAAKEDHEKVFNLPRTKFQFNVLEKEQKWLSDQEADELMKNKI